MTTTVITGANTGIGRATAHELARRGHHIVFAGRNESATEPAMEEIERLEGNSGSRFLPLDLADLESCLAAADTLLSWDLGFDRLILNAGVGGQRGVTKQGFELNFGINHLGHFAFASSVIDALISSSTPQDPARLVVVSSGSHYEASQGINYSVLRRPTQSVSGMPEYAVSKLANVLFASEVARRHRAPALVSVSLHPGNLIGTDIMRRGPKFLGKIMKRLRPSPEVGAKTSVMCATDAAVADHSGAYYSVLELKEPSSAVTQEAAAELWERSQEWIEPYR